MKIVFPALYYYTSFYNYWDYSLFIRIIDTDIIVTIYIDEYILLVII